jgi:hypothetical protein
LEELFDELSGSARSLGPADWPEPANLRRRAEHRRTVRRASMASSVAVVAAVAIAVPAALAGHRNAVSPTGHTATEPVTTHKAASTPGPSRIPAGTSATPAADTTIGVPLPAGALAPAGQRQAFGKVSLVVPDGWQVYRHAQPSPYDPRHEVSDEACIAPPPAPSVRSLFDCAGLEVFYGGFLPAEGTNKYDSNRERSAAWHHGTGAPTCPGTLDNPGVPAVTPLSGPADWTFPEIGSERKAQYTDWHVACADGTSFNPQAWYLPRTRVLFFSYVSDPTAQAILATAVVS